jgi:Mg2+ and Co2+ transporter CorA
LSEIDLRSTVFYHVEHINELPEENRSYLNQCIEKWNVLNLTEEYTKFEKELKQIHTNSLAQVLHQKNKIIEILLQGLKNATHFSLQPILE